MREQRPWALVAASLLLIVLAIVLWLKWAESRNRAARLEAQVHTLRAERDRVLKRLESVEGELAKGAARPERGGPSR